MSGRVAGKSRVPQRFVDLAEVRAEHFALDHAVGVLGELDLTARTSRRPPPRDLGEKRSRRSNASCSSKSRPASAPSRAGPPVALPRGQPPQGQ